ncbi:MAG: hypothetical protein COT18_00935 [Elusimicrobia bacterium CG08_land_8_20_14_0_20_59_10]|nr:MAG: hypothetical protein COT18_00935 [Elusimicrobia bacterium CG08_land_8_20_14_0_20_59_10]
MKIFFACLLLAAAALPVSADLVYLNKGDEINCLVTGMDAVSLHVLAGGEQKTFSRSEVMKIQLVKEYNSGLADPLKDPGIRALAQDPPKPQAYPNDGYINWLNETNIEINPDKSWTVARSGLRYVLRERGKSPAAYLSFNYLPGLETAAIDYAYAINGGTVSCMSDVSVMDGAPYMAYPAYDRLKLVKYAIPNVQAGSVLAYASRSATVHTSTYPFFSEVFFRFFEPVKTGRLTVAVPEGLELAYEELNMPAGFIFSKKKDAGRLVYTWELRDLQSYKQEPSAPPFRRYAPQIMLSLADSWENLRADLAPRLQERLILTQAIEDKAAELTAGKASDLEKTEALYNWTAKEIKFQPVPLDDFSYLPKAPEETFRQKAGNALDKPFLLYALLSAAGLNPEFAYGRSKSASFVEKLPNIRQFTYTECLVKTGGKTLALAPMGDTRRYFELSPELQGGRAFIVLARAGAPLFFENPEHAPAEEASFETAQYELNAEGGLSGGMRTRMTGGEQAGMRGYKDYKKEDLDRAMEKYAHSIHPRARLKSYKLDNLEDLSKNLNFGVEVSVDGYAMKAGRYMIFKVPGLEYSARDAAQTERELPLFWYSRSLDSRSLRLKLPPGYRLYYAPEKLEIDLAGQSYTASFGTDGGFLTFTAELKREKTWLEPSAYPEYKKFKQALAQFSENWIVLEKK